MPTRHEEDFSWTDPQTWIGSRRPLEQSTGLPPGTYTDLGYHQQEQERLFERAWVCVGLAPEVARPGPMLVRSLGSRSILITRASDGQVRGFLNSCRHRGTELAAADCDLVGSIRCPYHRWAYSPAGKLIATPFFEDLPRDHFDPDDFDLVSVRVDTWGPLLFACLDPRTPSLAEWLGDLPDRMRGYDFQRWAIREERTIDIEANWKLISENFQEYYQLTWVHPELSKVSRVADHYRYQGSGMYCGQTTTPVSGDQRGEWLSLPPAPGLDESDAISGRFVAVFPNVLLSVLPNHVFVMRLDPIEPGRTSETCTFLLPEGSIDVEEPAFSPTRRFWFDVNDEDIDIVQRGQRGLSRGAVPAGLHWPRASRSLSTGFTT